jgi:hypothetical protein
VIDLSEWLNIGWISSDRIEDRIEWFEERMPWKSNWAWTGECINEFLEAVRSDEDRLIWLAPRSAQERSGFHWYLHQLRTPPAQMIIADFPLTGAWRGEPPLSLGELAHEPMAELLDECRRSGWDSARFPMEKWRVLMEDTAVLRIINEGDLKSARP